MCTEFIAEFKFRIELMIGSQEIKHHTLLVKKIKVNIFNGITFIQ